MLRKLTISRREALAAMAVTAALAPLGARAQAWRPARNVRIVVPYAAGGITDIMARLLAAHLQTRWNQTVIVENKTGAAGILGTMEVVKAAPDGHTLLLGNTGPQAIAYSLFRELPYKPNQLSAVTNIITGSNLLVVDPKLPVSTVPEFVAWLKEQKGKVSYASSGAGSSTHLSASWFLRLVGAEATHVPYRGSAPAVNDVMAGVVSFYFDNLANGIEFVRAGKLKGLGVTSAKPSPYTELPPLASTMPELKDFDVTTFYGVFVTSGTSKEAIAEINAGVKKFLGLEATKKYLEQWASTPAWDSPEATERFVAAEIEKWSSMIEKEGIKLDLN